MTATMTKPATMTREPRSLIIADLSAARRRADELQGIAEAAWAWWKAAADHCTAVANESGRTAAEWSGIQIRYEIARERRDRMAAQYDAALETFLEASNLVRSIERAISLGQ